MCRSEQGTGPKHEAARHWVPTGSEWRRGRLRLICSFSTFCTVFCIHHGQEEERQTPVGENRHPGCAWAPPRGCWVVARPLQGCLEAAQLAGRAVACPMHLHVWAPPPAPPPPAPATRSLLRALCHGGGCNDCRWRTTWRRRGARSGWAWRWAACLTLTSFSRTRRVAIGFLWNQLEQRCGRGICGAGCDGVWDSGVAP